MHPLLQVPFDPAQVLAKKKRIRREQLAEGCSRTPCRIAILGGSTTAPLKDVLELFLLDRGIQPQFYESEYNRWYEDLQFGCPALEAFQPQIVYLHTSVVNLVKEFPPAGASKEAAEAAVKSAYQRYADCWEAIHQKYHAAIVQNNFELPMTRRYGNLDAWVEDGTVRFVQRMNHLFADAAATTSQLYLQDLQHISAQFGLARWFDREFYALYKMAMAAEAIPYIAQNLAAIIGAIMGKSRKCLVLDLDHTLWGGIISEDGVAGLEIGHETALGESYLAWQEYVRQLKERGVILAVCSKNDQEIALRGFSHPDCLLKPEDFVSFQANWDSKDTNLKRIAQEINIGLDSLVFIDDSPMERALIRSQLPIVAVPEVDGGEPFSYIRAIEQGKYFETVSVSQDDRLRTDTYLQNKKREKLAENSSSYEEFLRSLAMEAEIAPFQDVYLARIAQLTNKSNQFNLTTRRYTEEELRQIASDERYLTLYGRLKDRFGDNGLVSVVIGEKDGAVLKIRLWLMSCRVLRRGLEYAMLDALAEWAEKSRMKELQGDYYPTRKNQMVANLYEQFGFSKVFEDSGHHTIWRLSLDDYRPRNHLIQR